MLVVLSSLLFFLYCKLAPKLHWIFSLNISHIIFLSLSFPSNTNALATSCLVYCMSFIKHFHPIYSTNFFQITFLKIQFSHVIPLLKVFYGYPITKNNSLNFPVWKTFHFTKIHTTLDSLIPPKPPRAGMSFLY